MKKAIGLVLATILLLSFVACDKQPVAPGAPAEFTQLKIANTQMQNLNSAGSYIKVTLPNEAGRLVENVNVDGKVLFTTGTASLVGATTNISVTHGLGGTPSRVFVLSESAVGTASSATGVNQLFWGSASSTVFFIKAVVATNTTATIDWIAFR